MAEDCAPSGQWAGVEAGRLAGRLRQPGSLSPFGCLWPEKPLGEALPGAASSCGVLQMWLGREGRLSEHNTLGGGWGSSPSPLTWAACGWDWGHQLCP